MLMGSDTSQNRCWWFPFPQKISRGARCTVRRKLAHLRAYRAVHAYHDLLLTHLKARLVSRSEV